MIHEVPPVLPTFPESLANLEDSGCDSQSNSSTCQTLSQGNGSASSSTNDIQDDTYEIPNNPEDNIYETVEDCKQRYTIPEATNPVERTNPINLVTDELKLIAKCVDKLIKVGLIDYLSNIQDIVNAIIDMRQGNDDKLKEDQKKKLIKIKIEIKSEGSFQRAIALYTHINLLDNTKLLIKTHEKESNKLKPDLEKIFKDANHLAKEIKPKKKRSIFNLLPSTGKTKSSKTKKEELFTDL